MRTLVSRLIRYKSYIAQRWYVSADSGGRYLSTGSNNIDEPFNVEEAETVHVHPPPTEKLLVLGGNGFVGGHVCKEALARGLSVYSLSSYRSSVPSRDCGCSWNTTLQPTEVKISQFL